MLPIQITIRGIPHSDALESKIRQRVEKLSHFYHRISRCHVVVELPQKHKHQGKLYNVRINLMVPGKGLVVTRKYDEDAYIAIRDAFNALERQVEAYAQRRQGQVKTHQHAMYGQVTKIMSEEGYGFIQGMDGNEYYFNMTNVTHPDDFDKLCVGDGVEYIAETVSDGRQACHVLKMRSHHDAVLS
jgi:ribosomal subunit interface protein